MLIGIVGNYGNNNQGDEAILEGILYQLKTVYQIERKDIIVFSNQPEQTKEKYGVRSVKLYYKKRNSALTLLTTMFKNRSKVRELDMLIVGGGGIFMDLYGREAFLFGMYGWLAKLSRTPVVLYAVGGGPILTRIGKVILRSLAHLAKVVTVRDPASKVLLQEIGVKSAIHVIGDPAFQVKGPEIVKKSNESFNIGVTAVPFHHESYWPNEDIGKYNDYIAGMARNLDYLLEKYPAGIVNFFATKWPQDIMVTEDIQALMIHKERCTICRKSLEPRDIVEFTSKQDILIGTRLHSLILALVTSTPIISVSYHHKVQDFMDMIDCSGYNIPIDQLNEQEDFFYESYHHMERNWDATIIRFEAISLSMKEKALNGMKLVKRTFSKAKNKRVLVLSNMYPSERSQTFGIFVKNQAVLLREHGFDVDVIAINDPRNQKFFLLKKYSIFLVHNIWNLITRGWKYDAIHVHYIFPTGIIGLLYKKLWKKQLIVTSHGGDIDQMSKKSPFIQKLTRKILTESDQIIAVGEGLREDIETNFAIPEDKISVINMGVDRTVFRPQDKQSMRRVLGFSKDEKVLLFVGNLIHAKGLDDLLDAYELMIEKEADITLHIVGARNDIAYFNTLKERAESYPGVVIHDVKAQRDIAHWMAAADLFILPSHIEGFGLVALEAMACGLPVVGTDVGGLSYLLANDNGVKVQVRNPEDIATKVLGVLRDEELRTNLITNGLKQADAYDQEKLIRSVIELYRL